MDTRPATTRLFLALWPDPAVRDALRTWRDLWSWPRGASPVATDKLHLTLHFLGSQPSERLPTVSRTVRTIQAAASQASSPAAATSAAVGSASGPAPAAVDEPVDESGLLQNIEMEPGCRQVKPDRLGQGGRVHGTVGRAQVVEQAPT